MNAMHNSIRSTVACQLLASLFLLGLLSGCGGEDAQQIRHDSVREHQISAALPAAYSPPAEPTNPIPSDSTPETVAGKKPTTADSTKPKKQEGTKKDSIRTTATAPSSPASSKSQATGTSGGNAKGGAEQGTQAQTACSEVTPEMTTQGRSLFIGRGNCISCHGSDGKGNALGPDLTDSKWLHINGDYPSIVDIVRKGVNLVVEHPTPMPPMGGSRLSDSELCAVSAYVWSLSHPQ